MRVVLEVVAGPLSGRRFHLMRNQRLEVGSTAKAEVCIRGDNNLAAQQFALETDQQVCRVQDLGRQGTTLVNGQPVESAVVREGDEIRAGLSRFVVHVEGDAANVPAERVPAKAAPAAARRPARKPGQAAYKSIVCDTGLTRYEGDVATFPPAELAAALAAQSPAYLLADHRRLAHPALAQIKTPNYLFDWLGEAAVHCSPLVISPGDVPDVGDIVAQGFGLDAVACFFAKEESDAAVKSLRAGVRVANDKVMGICWPKILSYVLSHYQPNYVRRLMEPFACVLIEDPNLADRWQLYSSASLEEQLQSLGLSPATTVG
jgi:type III secretion system (T3SS) inner membrane Yop/YscD-like protein